MRFTPDASPQNPSKLVARCCLACNNPAQTHNDSDEVQRAACRRFQPVISCVHHWGQPRGRQCSPGDRTHFRLSELIPAWLHICQSGLHCDKTTFFVLFWTTRLDLPVIKEKQAGNKKGDLDTSTICDKRRIIFHCSQWSVL